MKIGLSLSRCVRDIVEGRVDINDILVIVSRTDFDPTDKEQWDSIWEGYQYLNPEWIGLDHDETFEVVRALWDRGLLHQPRKFGAHPRRMPYYWLETVLVDGDLEHNSAAQDAWNQFQVIAGLTDVSLHKDRG